MRVVGNQIEQLSRKLDAQPLQEAPIDMRLTLRNLVRKGRELTSRHSWGADEAEARADAVVAALSQTMPVDLERFLNHSQIRQQRSELEGIAEEYPERDGRPRAGGGARCRRRRSWRARCGEGRRWREVRAVASRPGALSGPSRSPGGARRPTLRRTFRPSGRYHEPTQDRPTTVSEPVQ